ncbi:LuxR family transcriptional regulator [Nonomuraea rosea]|uniref:LuxR family transcriptional regulator n=1 Tax=Nonomuraea rosea TaxID=638574 RepID=A0ABP6YEY2_9ACTN
MKSRFGAEGGYVAFGPVFSPILVGVPAEQRETGTVLEALGLTDGEEAVYRFLIDAPSAARELAAALDRPLPSVEEDLLALIGRGLVSRVAGSPVRYVAAPPSVGLGGLLTARREELRTAELAIVALTEQHRMAATDRAVGDLIEVVTGVEAVRQRFLQIQWAATKQVRSFSTVPFVAVSPSDNTAENQGVDRGVTYRVVVEREVLAAPGVAAGTIDSVRRGVQVRVVDKLPIKLMMADGELALVPLTTEPGEPAAVLLHRSGLLAAVEALFEAVWLRAYPLRVDGAGALDEQPEAVVTELDRKILALLLAGLTDETVAGQLDLSLRTLQRRLRALMDLAGVRTRVQLGWHAARHDWA